METVLWLTLAVGLLGAASADNPCNPRLLVGQRRGGSRNVTVRAPYGCNCTDMRLQVLQDDGWVAGNGSCSDCSWRDVKKRNRSVVLEADRRVSWTVFYAGRYRPSVGRCTCDPSDEAECAGFIGEVKGAELWVDGMANQTAWNVTVWLTQTASGDMAVQVRQVVDDEAPYFFRSLRVTMRSNDTRSKTKAVRCRTADNCEIVIFNARPGRYEVRVSPMHVISPASGEIVRVITQEVTAHEESRPPAAPSRQSSKSLYIVLGVVTACAVAFGILCIVSRSRRDSWANWLPFGDATMLAPAAKATGSDAAMTLIFHRGLDRLAPLPLDHLCSYLTEHGVDVRDFRNRELLGLLHRQPSLHDALGLEPLRGARLLFVSSGAPDEAASSSARPLVQQYDSVLRQVRNARLALDYDRVFTVTLGGAAGPALAGLPEGRLFRSPEDLQLLVEHLRAPAARPPAPVIGLDDAAWDKV
ncbi:uncharacterized protein LOC119093806 [Pollicipes pollicipes]|uniref:uncharacterized protein LOC119093806 n=1 Tax=Pollicipes pollicipes TaxID=41117 RepID=UPI001884D7E4|nr:uncharacterized protein LOC119093806 [Pollicipes pollicipes]